MIINNRRIITSLIAIGLLVAASGVGTYAAFSVQVKSTSNSITAGTVRLNNEKGDITLSNLFTVANAKPGVESIASPIGAVSTGSLPVKLNVTFNPVFKDENGAILNSSSYSLFKVLPTITYKYKDATTGDIKTVVKSDIDWVSATALQDTINNYLLDGTTAFKNIEFKNGEGVDIALKTKLDAEAPNTYQAVSVSGDFTIIADLAR